MMRRYEALLLTVPEITQDEARNLENQMTSIIQNAKGSVISFERWGKYRLMYQVNKNDYGVRYLMRFDIPQGSTVLEDLRTHFVIKLGDIVMRSMVSALDPDEPLTYQRPKSLEEMPTSRDVNTFLKENRMDGLLTGQEVSEETEQA